MVLTSTTCCSSVLCLLLLLALPAASAPGARALAAAAEREHRFDDAQDVLQVYLEQHPRDGMAWLQLASVATVVGNLRLGERACDNAAPWIDPIATLACRGRLALLTQQHLQALQPLDRVLRSTAYRRRDDRLTLWAAGVAAELAAALGRNRDADRLFTRALQGAPSEQITAAWYDHLLATDRPEAVIADIDPWRTPMSIQLRHLIALKRLGRLDEGRHQVRYLDWEFRAEIARDDYRHAREFALFYLEVLPRPELARAAADRNLYSQREAEDYALYHRTRRTPQ